jgi:hypothetical protein
MPAFYFSKKIMTRNLFPLLLYFSAILIMGCSVSKDPLQTQLKHLQKGIIKEDTSYAYSLPYAYNTSHCLVQVTLATIHIKTGPPLISK